MGWKVKRRASASGPLARMQAIIRRFQQHERDRRRDLARLGPQSAAIVAGPLVAGTVARVAMMVAGAFQHLPRAERAWKLGVVLAGWGQSQVEALLRDLPSSARPACGAGCAACCVIPVSTSPLEALTIAETLRQTLSPEALASLLSRLRTRVHERQGWDQEQRWAQRRPCVFLTTNRLCSIYEVRPMMCRGYTSRRREDCEAEDMDRVEHLIPLTMFVNGVHLGLRETFTAAGWDHRSIELESGILCALETPDAAQRWQQGEPVFQGCDRLVESDPVADQELLTQLTRKVDMTPLQPRRAVLPWRGAGGDGGERGPDDRKSGDDGESREIFTDIRACRRMSGRSTRERGGDRLANRDSDLLRGTRALGSLH